MEDTTPMPFGKHKGKPMQDVPAGYLHWLYHQEDFDRQSEIGLYIKENLHALKMENEDLIWEE